MFGPPIFMMTFYAPTSAENLLEGAAMLEMGLPVLWEGKEEPALDKLAQRFAELPKVTIFRAIVENWDITRIITEVYPPVFS